MNGLATILADGGHWHDMDGGGWWVVMALAMALFWGLVILGGIWLLRELTGRRRRESEPLQVLDRRLAEGAISPEDYRERRAILTGTASPPRPDEGG